MLNTKKKVTIKAFIVNIIVNFYYRKVRIQNWFVHRYQKMAYWLSNHHYRHWNIMMVKNVFPFNINNDNQRRKFNDFWWLEKILINIQHTHTHHLSYRICLIFFVFLFWLLFVVTTIQIHTNTNNKQNTRQHYIHQFFFRCAFHLYLEFNSIWIRCL